MDEFCAIGGEGQVDFDAAMASGRFAVVLGSAGVSKTSGYILELLKWASSKNQRAVVVAASGSAVCQLVATCRHFLPSSLFERVRVAGMLPWMPLPSHGLYTVLCNRVWKRQALSALGGIGSLAYTQQRRTEWPGSSKPLSLPAPWLHLPWMHRQYCGRRSPSTIKSALLQSMSL